MDNNDRVYDYMAAAEESIKQMDLMVRQIPGHIKSAVSTTLTDEWRKLTVFTEVSEATGDVNGAINEVRDLVKTLRQTIWMAIAVGIVIATAIPIFAWAVVGK